MITPCQQPQGRIFAACIQTSNNYDRLYNFDPICQLMLLKAIQSFMMIPKYVIFSDICRLI